MSDTLSQAVELLAAGDLDNARGWYKRAEREFPGAEAAPAEIAAARRAIAGGV
jgi:hypothetical protein